MSRHPKQYALSKIGSYIQSCDNECKPAQCAVHICTAHVNIVYECMNGFKNSLNDLTRGNALVHQPLPRRPSIDLHISHLANYIRPNLEPQAFAGRSL